MNCIVLFMFVYIDDLYMMCLLYYYMILFRSQILVYICFLICCYLFWSMIVNYLKHMIFTYLVGNYITCVV